MGHFQLQRALNESYRKSCGSDTVNIVDIEALSFVGHWMALLLTLVEWLLEPSSQIVGVTAWGPDLVTNSFYFQFALKIMTCLVGKLIRDRESIVLFYSPSNSFVSNP